MAAHLTVVVVEDHHLLREATVATLIDAGFQAHGVMSAEDLGHLALKDQPDIYVLDINLPGEDGMALAQRLRQTHPQCGIIMLTARDLKHDRIEGYKSGADVYLTKPTDPDELIAAMQSVASRVRRSDTQSKSADGRVRLLAQTRVLSGPGGTETLSQREVDVLCALVRARAHYLEYWELMEVMGEDPSTYQKASLEVAMTRIRQKLAAVGQDPAGLVALRGKGYQMKETIEIA